MVACEETILNPNTSQSESKMEQKTFANDPLIDGFGNQFVISGGIQIRFALRWHGVDYDPGDGHAPCEKIGCQDCVIPNCPCPLGMCMTIGWALSIDSMNSYWQSIESGGFLGYGNIYINQSEQTVIIEFDQQTGVNGSQIPGADITKDYIDIVPNYTVPSTIVSSLNVSSIIVNSGTFEVDYSSNQFGTVTFNATIVP